MTLGDYWKYVPDDQYKSPRAVIDMLVEIAAKGGNLLLGIGPDPQGNIPLQAETCLRQVGKWLAINGEAIHGTRPVAPYKSQNVFFTSNPPYIYAIIRKLTEQQLHTRQVIIEGIRPQPGSQVNVLGVLGAVKWQQIDHGFSVELPKMSVTDEHGWVVQFCKSEMAS
jgi:alpha-L-fucosidase